MCDAPHGVPRAGRGFDTEEDDVNEKQAERMRHGAGFIAALDQSGGSTPRTLRAYGIPDDAYSTEEEMFALVHEMRARVMTSPSFTSEKIIGSILFERTMDSEVEGRPTAEYLWEVKGIVPILKIDKGLLEEENHVRLMKPVPGLEELLARALAKGVFATKARSVILDADAAGVAANVDQQFELGNRVLDAGLVPIIEPEVDIHAPSKEEAEEQMLEALVRNLDALPEGRQVMLKLTIPSVDGLFSGLVEHPRIMRVVALSGGYTRAEANERLARNPGVVASFSRALLEGLDVNQSPEEFDATLAQSIDEIFRASMA